MYQFPALATLIYVDWLPTGQWSAAKGMGMRRPEGVQKGFVRADTVLDQYQFFLIFRGVQGDKVLDRSLFHGVLLTQILDGISLSVPSAPT